MDDLMKLWECVWSAEFSEGEPQSLAEGHSREGISNSFTLFVALAILESHRDSTMRYLEHFDEYLQYMNGLSMHLDVEATISQAQVLALALRALFEQKDRTGKASNSTDGGNAIQARLTEDAEDLRALVF